MPLKIRPSVFSLRKILIASFSTNLLLCLLIASAPGQPAVNSESGGLYAGIELSGDGIKTVALRFASQEPSLKLVYSENVHLSLGRTSSGKFAPRASEEAAQAVFKLLSRLEQQYQVPESRIYLIGSSSLGADHPDDLVGIIKQTT